MTVAQELRTLSEREREQLAHLVYGDRWKSIKQFWSRRMIEIDLVKELSLARMEDREDEERKEVEARRVDAKANSSAKPTRVVSAGGHDAANFAPPPQHSRPQAAGGAARTF